MPENYLQVPLPEMDGPSSEPGVDSVGPGTAFAMELRVDYEQAGIVGSDSRLVTKSNFWRDLYPGRLETRLRDAGVGDRVEESFAPGHLTGYLDGERFDAPRRGFRGDAVSAFIGEPRVGRFYPRGVLAGTRGLVQSDMRPLRVVGLDGDRIRVDSRHPLETTSVGLSVRVLAAWMTREEHGGVCNDIGMLGVSDGPGMQMPYAGLDTDFWAPDGFRRDDEAADTVFYARERLVHHLDRYAREQLVKAYARLVAPKARVLDLMSSWTSHLDELRDPVLVAGLGLNRAELAANPRLHERVVQDLNQTPVLPWHDASFDAVVCTASIEYLVNPRAVVAEVARVLRPGGRLVLAWSERWFPPKAIRLWTAMHPFERTGFVLECLRRDGRFANLSSFSRRGLPRPPDDPHAATTALSDPLYLLWGERTAH